MGVLGNDNREIGNLVRRLTDDNTVSPIGIEIQRMISASVARIDNRDVVTAGTHNYLGLGLDPECITAAVKAVRENGTGTCGSRMANGTYSSHISLERELAEFHGVDHCIIFSTGFMANLGTVSGLVGKGDYLFLDADSHASIFDASRATEATTFLFKHNDSENLEKKLSRVSGSGSAKLIVVEGVYSMLGDIAPLKEITSIAKKYNAYVLVDEAHSMGIYGANGIGRSESEGVLEDVDFIVGTFSKSLGAVGGYCVSKHGCLELLRVAARAYMFTASLPPATVASVRQSLAIIRGSSSHRDKLWENINLFHGLLSSKGVTLAAPPGPITAIVVQDLEHLERAWRSIFEAGFYVNIGMPPATPKDVFLLRCALSSAHSFDQISGLATAILDSLFDKNAPGRKRT